MGYIEKQTLTLPILSGSFSPADSTTYYLGGTTTPPTTSQDLAKIVIPYTGSIRGCHIEVYTDTVAVSGENVEFILRRNATTDHTVETKGLSQYTTFSKMTLNIPVVPGDYIEVKMICPAWATNPTGVRIAGVIYVS